MKFLPDIYQKNLFSINYKKLKSVGIKCLLLDLDNTIAPYSMSTPDYKIKSLIEELKDMGFRVIIISNSGKKRLEPFKNQLGIDVAASACKPSKRKYKKVMELYSLKDNEIACVGDQLVTDVFGANRMGLTSILINPIGYDRFPTRITRMIERKIMKKYHRLGLFTKGNYYD